MLHVMVEHIKAIIFFPLFGRQKQKKNVEVDAQSLQKPLSVATQSLLLITHYR